MARYHALVVVIFAGCGNSGHAAPDARALDAPSPDARPIDASPDAAIASGTHHHFVISNEQLPTSNISAKALGLDLDGDGVVDNQLGEVLGTLATQGFPSQAAATKAIDTGTILMLVDLQAGDLMTATDAGFTLLGGADPMPPACASAADTVCRHHLDGNGMFSIAANSPHDTPLLGSIVNGAYAAGPGTLTIQVPILTATALTLPLVGARVKLAGASASGFTGAIVAGAVTQDTLNTTVFPAIQATMNTFIMRDCSALTMPDATPACGCTSGSQGATAEALFDTAAPKDCAVSLAEIETNSVIVALFATDLTIGGQKAISFGMGVDAVAATFTP